MKDKVKNIVKRIVLDGGFLLQFSKDDFKGKYAGSMLGVTWAFLQPIITIVLYWFIFQLGFKSQPVADFPFILWLISGLIPWFFVSEAITNGTASLVEYSYLVKKVLFNINILPLAKVLSVLFIHFFLVLFCIIVFAFYGYLPSVYYLQLPIYIVYMLVLVAGIVYFTSTLYVFFKDLMQIVTIVLQIVFWTTPFVWELTQMPEAIGKVLKYTPLYYIVEGYRNIFIYKVWFWECGARGLLYWGVALFLLLIGMGTFKKCKVHFADVL